MKILLVLTLLLSSCSNIANDKWSIVYKNDKEGNAMIGSKEGLVNAVRKGASIKIGWGVKGKTHTIEHLSNPIWMAVLDETEVMAHLDPQFLSKIDWDNLTANYADSTLLTEEWRVVLTTKGTFDAIWYDRVNDKVVKRRPQNHTITWFVKDVDQNYIASPLFN